MNLHKNVLLLLLTLGAFTHTSQAQTVNGKSLTEIDAEYIEISATSTGKLLSSAVTIDIDFGQLDVSLGNKITEIRDENGKAVVFDSMMGALNFMHKLSYELVQVYVLTRSSGDVRYFIMKRKARPRTEEG
ncbi:hypothetical protein [Telluribacter sp.]|jgi:uncharacterized protein YheU (UPF0270 family)|uniref:hypothetical protein n=1 Tax=Telluribacter sp. TaxID=1978767 RepID=UPI002E10DEF9|nr:hypothetical protein [Telluribacter sp.]